MTQINLPANNIQGLLQKTSNVSHKQINRYIMANTAYANAQTRSIYKVTVVPLQNSEDRPRCQPKASIVACAGRRPACMLLMIMRKILNF